jgi:hypothetical protein
MADNEPLLEKLVNNFAEYAVASYFIGISYRIWDGPFSKGPGTGGGTGIGPV